MEFVHSRGMVYRDLKPANILIDGSGRIRIGDFGSAKIIEGAVYLSGNYQGTIQYQAPEIYGEDPYTGKVDVFSFALVLYEILVGRPVYPAKLSLTQIMKKVCSKIRADLPSEINDDVKTLISQCWSHNPDSRLSLSEISRNSSESNSGSFPTLIRMPLNNISLIFTVNTTNERALEESASFLTVNHHK
jgi:serine/threonine protein kinase